MKKGFTLAELIGVVIILALISLLAFPPILNSIRKTKGELSDASKEILYNATSLYVSENLNDFPKTNGNTFCVTLNTLVTNEYLPTKVYDATTGEEISLDSKVEVKVENDSYTYNMNNECVEKIVFACTNQDSLICRLYNQYQEGNTTGLVKDSTNENLYYYTGTNGEVANNFLWYGGHQWRVLEFDTEANTITLITQQPLTAIQPASSGWESQEAYESSYINTWLNDYFWNSLDSNIQNNILDSTFNIGIYTDVDEITTTQKVGLLDEDQYKRAGEADSFLDIKDYWWLGNRYSSSSVRSVNSIGLLYDDSPVYAFGVRAVIKISDITITGGDGTLTSNYKTDDKATNTNNVQVGEYINVPYSGNDNACGDDNMCTFRVVSKDDDSIKVVLNGLLPDKNTYGSSPTISTSHTIYTSLSTFAEGISDTYRYTGNKTFYIGDYPNGANYKDVQDETLEASIGLPTVGEMFSGNDIDVYEVSTDENKTFVDVNTIENPTVSIIYWTMNRYIYPDVWGVYGFGFLYNIEPFYAYGVRSVIYLKSGTSAITFTGGEGTPNSPYELQ